MNGRTPLKAFTDGLTKHHKKEVTSEPKSLEIAA
jgi:hypothetical protein